MSDNRPELKYTYDQTPLNRAYETRRDTDTFKTPSISIYDVDFAILHFLKNSIVLKIEENGVMIDVPIIYASAEIWSQVQKQGYLRDVNKKLMTPYALIHRSSMSEDRRFRKLDVNHAPISSNIIITPKERNFENQRDLHAKTQNSKPADEYYISVVPEFYQVRYDLVLYTTFVEQMNGLVQDIIVTSNFMWGDSYQFRTVVGDVQFSTINPGGQERITRASMPLTVDARLQNEFELRKSTLQKAFSIKRLVFRNERSSFDIQAVNEIPGKK